MSFEMNVERLCQDFNPGKFLVYTSILTFTILFSLRLDEAITCTYWLVFTPLWIWNLVVVIGALVGTIVWWKNPHFRVEGEAYAQYKGMMITFSLHLLLLMFEVLVCDKLESDRHDWVLVFVPLIFISIISIAICIWAVKNDRSFDLELFCSVNILQFIFLALRLDNFIRWKWEVVFIPLWILLCVSLVGVLYSIIFAGVLLRAPDITAEQRRTSTNTAINYTCIVIPTLVFQVLLTNKLDGDLNLQFIGVASPLFLTFTQLILMSFSNKRSNKWWFGIRKNFCSFLFDMCPCLEEFCNISYSVQNESEEEGGGGSRRRREADEAQNNLPGPSNSPIKTTLITCKVNAKPIMPIISIEMPD